MSVSCVIESTGRAGGTRGASSRPRAGPRPRSHRSPSRSRSRRPRRPERTAASVPPMRPRSGRRCSSGSAVPRPRSGRSSRTRSGVPPRRARRRGLRRPRPRPPCHGIVSSAGPTHPARDRAEGTRRSGSSLPRLRRRLLRLSALPRLLRLSALPRLLRLSALPRLRTAGLRRISTWLAPTGLLRVVGRPLALAVRLLRDVPLVPVVRSARTPVRIVRRCGAHGVPLCLDARPPRPRTQDSTKTVPTGNACQGVTMPPFTFSVSPTT